MNRPLLVELDHDTVTAHLDHVLPWLVTTRTLQSAYRKILEDTADEVGEPHIRAWLHEIAAPARQHEEAVADLYRAFGHQPPTATSSRVTPVVATVLGAARELAGEAQGLVAGARGRAWRHLRMLMLSNLDAISGFAVAEQLALALGRPAVVDITVPIVADKTRHQLLIRECFLEMASNAILYRRDV
ncbi:hypothetical protein NCC78_07635 [Micromonospora phytophila]|uniref:hypothetical protein n=1 Tax=Micromonospora phytophila TaxID=709888 RepID=UPI00202EE05D|nr:hypothetical protein [Micromonospora phytophila]MCM0674556.1 hypothetical protein [Micromonospora phytophila]